MKTVILAKPELKEKSEIFLKVKKELEKNNIEVLPSVSDLEKADFVIALGGDGTIFHVASDTMWKNKPVLGINAGRLGFLAQLEIDDLSDLKKITTKEYTVENRLVLKVTLNDKVFYAVNDLVIASSGYGRVYDIDVNCNNKHVGTYRCDGLIFATPTGSTAYCVSAGGPIADPTIDCIIMTPIAPHSLVSRSIVFSGKDVLNVYSPKTYGSDFDLVIDGKNVGKLIKESDVVKIEKADVLSKFICINGKEFYATLNEKMKRRG